MALASAGSWVRFALERTVRIDTHTWAYAVACAVAGAGLVVAGACSLRLSARAARLSWRALFGWAAAVQVLAFGALSLTSSDVFTNLCFGALSLAGLSPYAHAPLELVGSPLVELVPARWVRDPSPYGPLFHPFVKWAALVGERTAAPFWGTFLSYKAVMLAAVLGALALAARHLRRDRPAEAAESFTALALGPLIAWEVTAQGHNDGLLFLAVVAFAVSAAARREAVAVAALACGVAVKYALAPLLGLYLLLLARRSLARAAALGLLAALIVGAALAPEWRSITLRAVIPMVGGESARHVRSLTDLACLVLDALALPRASLYAYRVLSLGSTLLCAGLLLRVAMSARTLEDLAHGYLLFLLALYLTAPWFQPWYVSWALPLLLLEPSPAWRRFVAIFAVVTVEQWALPLDPVTTVLGDLWAARQIWRLVKGDAPETAAEAARCGATAIDAA